MSLVIPRRLLCCAALVAAASCSLNHPQSPGDGAIVDADATSELPAPDADVPEVEPPTDTADVAVVDLPDAADAAVPEDADVPAGDDALDVPDVPDALDVPDVPDVLDVPDALDLPAVPDVPVALDVRDVPVVPDVPIALDVRDVPVVPDVPAVPDVRDVPVVPDACVGTGCVYASCAALPAGSTDGVYTLRGLSGTWRGYCDVPGDGSPPWTLIMKIDGSRRTFQYDAPLWENPTLLNPSDTTLDESEAKYEGYNATPVRQIRLLTETGAIGFRDSIITTVDASPPAPSLRAIIRREAPAPSILNSTALWAPPIPDAALQAACQRYGFNVAPVAGTNAARVRIGGVGDNDSGCGSPDTWVGVGGFVNSMCAAMDNSISAGNVYGCDGSNPSRVRASFVWVWVR